MELIYTELIRKKLYTLVCSNTNDRNNWAKAIEDASLAQEEEEINKDKRESLKENSTMTQLLGHSDALLETIAPKTNLKKEKR